MKNPNQQSLQQSKISPSFTHISVHPMEDSSSSLQQLSLQLEEWEQLIKEIHYFIGEVKIWAKPQRKI